MKFNVLLFSFSLLAFISCKKDEQQVVECLPSSLQSGLIAYYQFNSGSLQDESGQGNDLSNTTTAAPTTDRLGNSACAFGFVNNTGNAEFLTTTQSAFLNNLTSFSVSIWYQPHDDNRPGGDFETLVSRGTTPRCPDRRGEWSVGLYDCRRAVFGHENSVWAEQLSNPLDCEQEVDTLTDNWHHVVAVKNGNTFEIYFNGVLHEQATGIANCGVGGTHPAQDIGDFFVGSDFTGAIDDILIYNRALTAQEISDINDLTACCE